MEWILSYGETIGLMFMLAILVAVWGIYREVHAIADRVPKDQGGGAAE